MIKLEIPPGEAIEITIREPRTGREETCLAVKHVEHASGRVLLIHSYEGETIFERVLERTP